MKNYLVNTSKNMLRTESCQVNIAASSSGNVMLYCEIRKCLTSKMLRIIALTLWLSLKLIVRAVELKNSKNLYLSCILKPMELFSCIINDCNLLICYISFHAMSGHCCVGETNIFFLKRTGSLENAGYPIWHTNWATYLGTFIFHWPDFKTK